MALVKRVDETDRKAAFLERLGPPTGKQTSETWPCGCCLLEYRDLTDPDHDPTLFAGLCDEHRKLFEDRKSGGNGHSIEGGL